MKKCGFGKLILNLIISLGAGALSSFLAGNFDLYNELILPAFSPPPEVFPVVWTALYVLMGIAAWLICGRENNKSALRLYAAQLIVTVLWPILFFRLQAYSAAFLAAVFLWSLVVLTVDAFAKLNRTAAIILIPYIIWTTFAIYLSAGIWILN